MPKIIVSQPFKFAHLGYQVEEFEVSEKPRDTTEECADLAVAEGWATFDLSEAPENKDAASKRKTKAAA